MRLIDADSLYREGLNEYISEYGGDEYHFDETRFSRLIESEPTVDAVPVEWIEQYKQSIGSQTLVGYRWIEKMQIAWAERKEENERIES